MWSCSICRNIVCQHATHQHNVTLLAAHSCNSQRFGLAIAALLQCHKFVTVCAECVCRMWTCMCVLVCFSVSLCWKYLQSSKKTAPWIFFYPFLHVLDSWHLSTLGNLTSKDTLMCTPPNPNSLFSLCFHCWLKLNAAFHLLHTSLEMEA